MEHFIADTFTKAGIKYRSQVSSEEFVNVSKALGTDRKIFDFAIETSKKTYLVEVNFYSGSGSKLNEVARSYTEIGPKINNEEDFEFVWITDGIGWNVARNKLEEAYYAIPNVFNLTNMGDFIATVKDKA